MFLIEEITAMYELIWFFVGFLIVSILFIYGLCKHVQNQEVEEEISPEFKELLLKRIEDKRVVYIYDDRTTEPVVVLEDETPWEKLDK